MTSPPLLAALAAAFSPSRAASGLARAPDPAAAAEAARLAPLPRKARLDALARALATLPQPSPRARQLAAALERARVARLTLAADTRSVSPILLRLLKERAHAQMQIPGASSTVRQVASSSDRH